MPTGVGIDEKLMEEIRDVISGVYEKGGEMIFQATYQQVLDGTKTQTRRPVKPGDKAEPFIRGSLPDRDRIYRVRDASGRIKYEVGKTYAIQPGRGKKAIGRTLPIREIRRERVQDISDRDLRAEGMGTDYRDGEGYLHILGYFEMFKRTWESLYCPPYDWVSDPWVWVLVFPEEER